jgi:hypothetical protein
MSALTKAEQARAYLIFKLFKQLPSKIDQLTDEELLQLLRKQQELQRIREKAK